MILLPMLKTGGAEHQALILAAGLECRGHSVSIWTLFPGTHPDFDQRGRSFGLRSLFDSNPSGPVATALALLKAPWRLRRALRGSPIDVLYAMLYPATAVAALALEPNAPALVLGLRATTTQLNTPQAALLHLTALSGKASLLISNSYSSLLDHLRRGYRARSYWIIPNGVDTRHFKKDAAAGAALRATLGLDGSHRLIGRVARLSPIKGYECFVEAAARLVRRHPKMRFVCVGPGPPRYRAQLESKGRKLGIQHHLLWLGDRSDMVEIYSALDVVVSSSFGESFPNVVAEAMACGIPCVVTDVGDSRRIVGRLGRVVPPGDSLRMAEAIADLTTTSDAQRGQRQRIIETFGFDRMVDSTEAALLSLQPRVWGSPPETPGDRSLDGV